MSSMPQPVPIPEGTQTLPTGAPPLKRHPPCRDSATGVNVDDVEPTSPSTECTEAAFGKKTKKRKALDPSRAHEDEDELIRNDVDTALKEWCAVRGEMYDAAEKRKLSPPFLRFQEIEVDIVSQSVYGDGFAIAEEAGGWVVIVPFVLPGERVKAKIIKNFHGYSTADYISVSNLSEIRVQPQCAHFTVCSGCRLQHVPYQEQLKFKRSVVNRALAAFFSDLGENREADLPVGSPLVYGYRTKLTPHFHKLRNPGDKPALGFYREGRQSILDVEECVIGTKACNEGLAYCHQQIQKFTRVYKRGATLLIRETTDPETGEKTFETDNNKMVTEVFAGLKFRFPAGSFFQNNNSILPLLTSYVSSQLETHSPTAAPPRFLVDAYCGSGLFAVACHGPFEKVVGIEISEKSVAYASDNAAINGAQDKCLFVTGSAENVFEKVTESGMGWKGEETAMVIDPPRKGCDEDFLEQLLRFGPRVCVYVSCNAFTQARDLRYLRERWEESCGAVPKYRMVAVKPFDLFPHTRHIENVVTLVREGLDS